VDLSRKLPFTPVLAIDRAEEVFILARTSADEANRTLALEMLRRFDRQRRPYRTLKTAAVGRTAARKVS
jgi:hypothetical protein